MLLWRLVERASWIFTEGLTMPTINQLPTVTSLSGGDLFAVYNTGNGDARKVSATTLSSFISSQGDSTTYTQYESPSSGFVMQIQGTGLQTWLIVTPSSTLASGTFVLPAAGGVKDGMEIIVNTTRQISSVAFTLNGATAIYGNPAVLAAEDTFTLKYSVGLNSWFRVA
jgi:hypothetical protein